MFQPELETADPQRRAHVQAERLRDLVAHLAGCGAPFWAERLDGVEAEDVVGLERLTDLPFTVKGDLRGTYPWGLLAVERAACVRAHASSGTSGKPTVVAYTRGDLEVWADVVARAIACAGGRAGDVLQVAYGYGLFTGGLGLHGGAERLGATTIPASGGNTALQLQLLADLGAHGVACTPSFAMLLAERAAAQGVAGLQVRYLVSGAEPWSEAFRAKLQDAWSALCGHEVLARDIYGLSEVIGPGVAMECAEAPGALHVFDDHFLPEVVAPETGAPVPDGERGELVLTTLTKRAMPVLRYRTGDVTSLQRGTCACGRTHPRMGRIEGRTDDMLIIRGVNVFPREIEAEVLEEPALAGAYALVLDRRQTLVRLVVHAELAHGDAVPDGLEQRLRSRLHDRLRVSADVVVHPAGGLPRTEVGKVRRLYELTGDDEGVPDAYRAG